MIAGNASLIAHIGLPTHAFRAPAIRLRWRTGSNDPAGFGLVVNATPLVRAASAQGCRVQGGTYMPFEQIPADLEFFVLPSTRPQVLRALCRLGP